VLASLAIRNFVLIEDATLEFGPSLTALTGETGAGKTLLTKALGLLMGERAEEGFIGASADETLIQPSSSSMPRRQPNCLQTFASWRG
jgi:DNA repair protein RecN (Recombination protein N)